MSINVSEFVQPNEIKEVFRDFPKIEQRMDGMSQIPDLSGLFVMAIKKQGPQDPALIRIPRMPLFRSSGSPSYLIRT